MGYRQATQAEPRLGVAYNIKPSNTVLRVSYARTLGNSLQRKPGAFEHRMSRYGCRSTSLLLAAKAARTGHGRGEIANSTLPPGYRNEFHAGLQQAFGKYLVVDGEYIWKYTHNAYDFSILGYHANYFSDRVAQLEDSRLCHPRERARTTTV